ncbi:MAG TPA: methyltransferase domain-containing protein [Thermoanaerobaculia bacterium]|jgi:predicted SAM-dependent methyltransferase
MNLRRLLPPRVKAFGRALISTLRRDSVASARRKARAYLGNPACLHLGCGQQVIDGWLNVDVYPSDRRVVAFDVRTGLHFLDDASIDFIYNEHFFEHFDLRGGRKLLAECRRVLRPGGRMRISMPDLDRVVRRYLAGWADGAGEFRDYRRAFFGEPLLDTPGELLNLSLRGYEHRFLYAEPDIVRMLEQSGFRNVRRVAHGVSEAAAFVGLETRSAEKEPLIVEAEK